MGDEPLSLRKEMSAQLMDHSFPRQILLPPDVLLETAVSLFGDVPQNWECIGLQCGHRVFVRKLTKQEAAERFGTLIDDVIEQLNADRQYAEKAGL